MSDWQREDRVQLYLGYLEVEMTIMGVLSVFCVAAAGFVLKEAAGAEKGFMGVLWAASGDYLILGSAALIGAALCFYRQRSGLAWYHGQLCLSLQAGDDLVVRDTTGELLGLADGWETWIPYQRGFAWLSAGIAELLLGLVVARHPRFVSWCPRTMFAVGSLAIAVAAMVAYRVYRKSLDAERAAEEGTEASADKPA